MRYGVLFITLLTLVILPASPTPAYPSPFAQVPDNIRISPENAANGQSHPLILAHPSQSQALYAVWIDGREDHMAAYFSSSTDGGQTWSANLRVNEDTGLPEEIHPSLVIGSNGNLYLAWSDLRHDPTCDLGPGNCASAIYLASSTDGGQTWIGDTRIDDGTRQEHPSYPSLAIGPDGSVYAAWYEPESGILFARSTDQGQIWSANQIVAPATSTTPKLVAGSGSTLHLVFIYNDDVYSTSSADGGQTWSALVRVDDAGIGIQQSRPTLLLGSDGELYAAWLDRRNGFMDIYSSHSSDGGQTWSANRQANEAGVPVSTASSPALGLDPTGKLFMAWEGLYQIYVSASADQGDTWEPKVPVNDPSSLFTQSPTLGVDSAGGLFVAWTDFRNGNTDIYFSNSVDSGQTWGNERLINDDPGTGVQFYPALVAGETDQLYVAWWESRPDKNHIYFSRSADGGQTWGPGVQVEDVSHQPAQTPYPVGLGIDSNGVIFVAWVEYQDGIYVKSSLDNGQTFTNTMQVTDSPGVVALTPSLAVAPDDNLYLVWADNRNGNYDIFTSRSEDSGLTWTPNQPINDDTGENYQYQPAIAVQAGGHLYVAWSDGRNGNFDIYFSNSSDNGQNWSANLRVVDDPGSANQQYPSIAASPDGGLNLAWFDRRDGGGIYFASSSDGGDTWSINAPVNNSPTESYPSLAATGDGSLYLSFGDKTDRQYKDIYLAGSFDGGLTWTQGLRMNPLDHASQYDSSLAIDPSGSISIAWVDLRHGAESIYAASIPKSNQTSPTADFTADPTIGSPALDVHFSDQTSGYVFSWYWDFGDGWSSNEPGPLHTYIYTGVYTVSLSVTGPWGMDTHTRTNYITVATPPQADFEATPLSGVAPLQVAFMNLSTGDYAGSFWEFGDGTTSTQDNPQHTFTTAGVYSVTLTISGPVGSHTTTKPDYIHVMRSGLVYLPIIQR